MNELSSLPVNYTSPRSQLQMDPPNESNTPNKRLRCPWIQFFPDGKPLLMNLLNQF